MKILGIIATLLFFSGAGAQLQWQAVDTGWGDLPASVKVFQSKDVLNDGKPNSAWYIAIDLNDKKLALAVDTTKDRRLTPAQYYAKNDRPLIVMNTTFFSFATHQNLNVVIQNGKLTAYNIHSLPGRGADTLTYRHPFTAAIGISKKRKADIAWVFTDSSRKRAYAAQQPVPFLKDSLIQLTPGFIRQHNKKVGQRNQSFRKWKVQTAVGGGPVLVQDGKLSITNNEELKFAGKAIDDKHPRTAIGYTADNKLILLVVEGRNPGKAEGASLKQLADMLVQIGCTEAMNLDGGGSSCLLVNGKETIYPSDKGQQRPVPAVLLVKRMD